MVLDVQNRKEKQETNLSLRKILNLKDKHMYHFQNTNERFVEWKCKKMTFPPPPHWT